ncbi:N-acetylmannosamine-6-phosphate 2-epimerase, partial [Micromonospora sp. NPDC049089]
GDVGDQLGEPFGAAGGGEHVEALGGALAGYTAYTTKQPGPDLDLVARLSRSIDVPVVAEGRIHTPAHAAQALRAGAWTVVVGTAITHPSTITGWFTSAMANAGR